jgi:hypothetical protein
VWPKSGDGSSSSLKVLLTPSLAMVLSWSPEPKAPSGADSKGKALQEQALILRIPSLRQVRHVDDDELSRFRRCRCEIAEESLPDTGECPSNVYLHSLTPHASPGTVVK